MCRSNGLDEGGSFAIDPHGSYAETLPAVENDEFHIDEVLVRAGVADIETHQEVDRVSSSTRWRMLFVILAR